MSRRTSSSTAGRYNPAVLIQYADDLNERADTIVLFSTIAWGAGGFFGAFLGFPALFGYSGNPLLPAVVMAGFLGIVGYARGEKAAFTLRLQAQTVLCQLRIEENTRGAERGA